jgi:predicted permease
VLISDSLWRGQFAGDPRVIDTVIALNGAPHRIVGILPRGFSYPADATYWIPQAIRPRPGIGFIRPVIGRVKPGLTRDQAQADLDNWIGSLPPSTNRPRDMVARVTPLHDAMVRDVRLPLLVFGGAVALVLLIGCANVANLLLMRAVSRRHEIAARLALGASRRRLVRQFLAEGAVLSLAGGCLGVAAAFLAGPAILSMVPDGRIPSDVVIGVDGWVLAFAAGLSLLTGLLVGLAPLAQTTRRSLSGGLRPVTHRPTHRLRNALVVAEVALTVVLIVMAGLLVRSFVGLTRVALGFTPERVMTMTVDLPVRRYPDVEQAVRLHSMLLESMTALPGVESAAAVNWLPLGDLFLSGDVHAD